VKDDLHATQDRLSIRIQSEKIILRRNLFDKSCLGRILFHKKVWHAAHFLIIIFFFKLSIL